MNMKKLNFAIIGCGRISYKHVEGLYENKNVANLVATCDIKKDLAYAKAKEYINNFLNMVNEKEYNKENMDEALAFDEIYKQQSRKTCATLPYRALQKLLTKN